MTEEKFETLKPKFARSLKEYLYNEALAPLGERPVDFDLHLPYHHIKYDDDAENRALATVTYVVRCPTEKKHTVFIKFNYDKSGKFLRNTMEYV